MNEAFKNNQLPSIQSHPAVDHAPIGSDRNATAAAAAAALTLDTFSSNLTAATTTTIADVVSLSNILNDYLIHPIIVILLCLLSVFVVLGNLLVVTAIWHESQLHSVTNYLIASLAAADCLVGAIVMPSSIISEIILGSWIFGPIWCDLWHSFDVLASTASIMNLCAISLDRYLAITDPISYPSRMTPKRVALLIVFLWTCSSMISFPAIIWWHAVGQESLQQIAPSPSRPPPAAAAKSDLEDGVQYKCVFPDDTYYLLFSSFVSFYGPLCIMLYAYYRIYKAAIKQTRFLKHGSKQVMIDGNHKRNKRFRHVSEHLSCGASDRYGFSGGSLAMAPVDSYDRQHLVLRAHRGGSSNSTGGGGSAHPLCGGSVRLAGNNSAINFNTSPTSTAMRTKTSLTSTTNATSTAELTNATSAASTATVAINSASHSAASPNCVRNNNHNDNIEPNVECNATTDDNKTKQRNMSNCIKEETNTNSNIDEKLSTSLSTSSGSYGTGSIVSVLVRPNPPNPSAAGTAATTPPITAAATMVVTTNINGTGTAVTTTKTANNSRTGSGANSNKNSVSILNDKFSQHSPPKRQIANSTDHADQSAQLLHNEAQQLHQNNANHSPSMSNSMRQNHQQRTVGKKLTKLAKERKAAKTLGIVVGVFILCWLPFFVANIIIALCGIDCLFKPHILLSIVTWLGWLNSAMNPVIYACWSRDFRRAFRRVLLTWLKFVCPYFLSDR